jgi:hypothetical protein
MAKASSCEWLAYREVGSEHCTNEEIRFKNARFCVFFFGTNEFSNYRFLTPRLHAFPVLHGEFSSPFQLPVFDASKTEARIQETGFRSWQKSRRQKRVVRFTAASPQTEASETGSSVLFVVCRIRALADCGMAWDNAAFLKERIQQEVIKRDCY